jgi:hypothetical protein
MFSSTHYQKRTVIFLEILVRIHYTHSNEGPTITFGVLIILLVRILLRVFIFNVFSQSNFRSILTVAGKINLTIGQMFRSKVYCTYNVSKVLQ